MEYELGLRLGGGQALSNMSPIGWALLLTGGILVLVLPARRILDPLLVVLVLVPLGQQLVIASVHVSIPRALLLIALIRVYGCREEGRFVLSGYDRLFIWFVVASCVSFVILYHDLDAVKNRCGFVLDVAGSYLLARALVRDLYDVERATFVLAICCMILGSLMTFEHVVLRNPFYFLGGNAEAPAVREGRLRCQGPFLHPIMAGSFGAVMIPLFWGAWQRRGSHGWLLLMGSIRSLGHCGHVRLKRPGSIVGCRPERSGCLEDPK